MCGVSPSRLAERTPGTPPPRGTRACTRHCAVTPPAPTSRARSKQRSRPLPAEGKNPEGAAHGKAHCSPGFRPTCASLQHPSHGALCLLRPDWEAWQGPMGAGACPSPRAAHSSSLGPAGGGRRWLDRGLSPLTAIPRSSVTSRHRHEQMTLTTKVSWLARATSDRCEQCPEMTSLLGQTEGWPVVGSAPHGSVNQPTPRFGQWLNVTCVALRPQVAAVTAFTEHRLCGRHMTYAHKLAGPSGPLGGHSPLP